MRVIIVGLHNKKGLKPLDSSTKSGEIIDRISNKLQLKVKKTNLFNIDRMPTKEEKKKLHEEWFWTHLPCYDDIVVLLGSIVHKEFKHDVNKLVKVHHPGYVLRPWSKINKDEYINGVVADIKKYFN